MAYQALERPDQAIAAYRAALAREPDQAGWRLELALLLRQQGRLAEAQSEVGTLLAQQPNNTRALDLRTELAREIAEKH